MKTCPHCKGKRVFPVLKQDEIRMGPSELDDVPVQYGEVKCSECDGAGKVSELAYAIYIGRGGPRPAPIRDGHA